jgi:hypothetical protein
MDYPGKIGAAVDEPEKILDFHILGDIHSPAGVAKRRFDVADSG